MKVNLLEAVKTRLFDELEETLGKNSEYKDKVKVYHKFPYKERVSSGVVLKNVSFNRHKLSPDDFVGVLKSHCAVAHAGNHPGEFLEWVWEDAANVVKRAKEDVSSQIDGTNRFITLSHSPITQGPGNTELADNFRQVDVYLDGERTYAESVDAKKGIIALYGAPASGVSVDVSYYYKNVTPPGRYYIEIVRDSTELKYVVNPLYAIKNEVVIENAKGNELGGDLQNQNVMTDQVILYMKKAGTDYSIKLIRGEEYTVTVAGEVEFIGGFSMEPNTNLVAHYRWIGEEMGPIVIPDNNHYDYKTIEGVVLCFNDKVNEGDKAVLIVYPNREVSARVYGGHFNVSVDLEVFTLDTVQLPGMVDYIVNDLWNNKRLRLMDEGITIDDLDSSGETEEAYDENTGDLYYKNSLSMTIMTEWKKFVPVVFEVLDFDLSFQTVTVQTNKYVHLFQNRVVSMDSELRPKGEPFEVKYPKPGYPRIS
jgi:hypothetical protein